MYIIKTILCRRLRRDSPKATSKAERPDLVYLSGMALTTLAASRMWSYKVKSPLHVHNKAMTTTTTTTRSATAKSSFWSRRRCTYEGIESTPLSAIDCHLCFLTSLTADSRSSAEVLKAQ